MLMVDTTKIGIIFTAVKNSVEYKSCPTAPVPRKIQRFFHRIFKTKAPTRIDMTK